MYYRFWYVLPTFYDLNSQIQSIIWVVSTHCQTQLFQTWAHFNTDTVLYFLRGLYISLWGQGGRKESHPASCFHFSSPSLQEKPLVKFSHSLGLAALSLFCKERYRWYFKATSNLISLPVLGRGGQTATALFAQLWDWFCSSRSKSCTLQPLVTQGRKIACEAQSRAKWWWKTCNAPALGW